MKSRMILSAFLAVLLTACGFETGSDPRAVPPEAVGTIERQAADFDNVIEAGARIEKVAEGFSWTEKPAWSGLHEAIVFSDSKNGHLFGWSEDGGIELLGKWALGKPVLVADLAMGPTGNLYYSHTTDTLIGIYTGLSGGETIQIVPRTQPRKGLKGITVAPDGSVYTIDMAYGEEPSPTIYRVAPSGDVTVIATDVSQPNGLALSPDGRYLYVANADQEDLGWKRYDTTADDLPVAGEAFHDAKQYVTGDKYGWVGGLAVDTDGRLYATGPDGGVYVISPEGDLLGILRPSQTTSDCAFGNDGSTLYMTSGPMLTRVRLKSVGAGFPLPSTE